MCWRLFILWNTTDQQKSSPKYFQRVSDLTFEGNLSQFGFGMVQLCFMSNREMWMRHKTDFLQPASACRQWSGLSSESWDTDLWSRNFGTMIETHGAVSTVVVRSENHMVLLLFNLWRRSCVKGCLDTHFISRDWWFLTATGQVICYWSQWKHITFSLAGSMSVQTKQKHGRLLLLWVRLKWLRVDRKELKWRSKWKFLVLYYASLAKRVYFAVWHCWKNKPVQHADVFLTVVYACETWCCIAATTVSVTQLSQSMRLDRYGAEAALWLRLATCEKFHLKHRWKSKVLQFWRSPKVGRKK